MKVVSSLPYGPIGVYEVRYKDRRAEIEVDDNRYMTAIHGNNRNQSSLVMEAKDALKVTQWVEFQELTIKRLRDADMMWGCGCECAGCDQGHHCRKHSTECYI